MLSEENQASRANQSKAKQSKAKQASKQSKAKQTKAKQATKPTKPNQNKTSEQTKEKHSPSQRKAYQGKLGRHFVEFMVFNSASLANQPRKKIKIIK